MYAYAYAGVYRHSGTEMLLRGVKERLTQEELFQNLSEAPTGMWALGPLPGVSLFSRWATSPQLLSPLVWKHCRPCLVTHPARQDFYSEGLASVLKPSPGL